MERFFSYNIPSKRTSGVVSLPHDDKTMARKTIAKKHKVKREDVKSLYLMEMGYRLS